jgi:hypothetical protein
MALERHSSSACINEFSASYISFYDPDGIAWELYAMPSGGA